MNGWVGAILAVALASLLFSMAAMPVLVLAVTANIQAKEGFDGYVYLDYNVNSYGRTTSTTDSNLHAECNNHLGKTVYRPYIDSTLLQYQMTQP